MFKKAQNCILPLGKSFVALIILSLILFSLFIGVGVFLIEYGLSDSIELFAFGILFIIISIIMIVLIDIWILFQCRIEFESENLIIYNFNVRGTVRFPKIKVPLYDLKKIEKLDAKTFRFEFVSHESNIIKLHSFSRKQITKIISNIASKSFFINNCNIEIIE